MNSHTLIEYNYICNAPKLDQICIWYQTYSPILDTIRGTLLILSNSSLNTHLQIDTTMNA